MSVQIDAIDVHDKCVGREKRDAGPRIPHSNRIRDGRMSCVRAAAGKRRVCGDLRARWNLRMVSLRRHSPVGDVAGTQYFILRWEIGDV